MIPLSEPCIQTVSGRRFYPLAPRVEDVDIEDIAHSLSMKCRYGGQCDAFYSVAEHSILVFREVGTLEALLHDAAEAYSPFGDVPRPIKQKLPLVVEIEEPIERAIAERFGLTYPWPAEVKMVDTRIIADEKRQLLSRSEPWEGFDDPLGVRVKLWPPFYAEKVFLQAFREAGGV